MKLQFHTWATIIILAVLVVWFGYLVGWDSTDVGKMLTHQINVLNYWALVSLFAFLYNGLSYKTWSVISSDPHSNSRVLAAILLGTAFVVGRSF